MCDGQYRSRYGREGRARDEGGRSIERQQRRCLRHSRPHWFDSRRAGGVSSPMMRTVVACLMLALPFAVLANEPAPPEKFFLVQFTVGEAWAAEKAPHEQAHFAEYSANLKRLRTEGKLVLGGR